MYSSSPSDLTNSTAVDESLSKTSTKCSVPENTNQCQDGMQYILIYLTHLFITHNTIAFGSFELILQCNNILIPLNAVVVCNAIVFYSFECNCS